MIGGEAGAGKTRLATEFSRRCHQDGAIVLCGLCDSELSLPYQPWVMVFDQLIDQLADAMLEDLRDDLGHLHVLLPRIERRVPGLPSNESLGPEAERHEMFMAVASVLRAAAGLAPIVLVLDDLHWAGRQTLALLRFLARSAPVDRLLIVGTFRDTGDEITEALASVLADLRRSDDVARLTLHGIDADDVIELLAATGSIGDLEAPAVAIVERTSGNPFLVSELALDADVVDAESVPQSVMEVVNGRLQRLSRPARHLTTAIAVGGTVELSVLRDAVGPDVPDIGTALSELLQAGLVQEIGGPVPRYQFTHALIRDAVSVSVPAFVRSEVHFALALALERLHEADRRLVLAQLTRHFAAAAAVHGPDKAVYYGRRAASQARRTAAYHEAIELLQVTLVAAPARSAERASLLVDVADLMERCGRQPEALEFAERAFEEARSIGDAELQALAAIELERAAHLRNEPSERAISMLESALASSDGLSPGLRAGLQASLGRAKTLVGDPRGPEEALTALEVARSVGDDATISHALEVACVAETNPVALLNLAGELESITAATGNVFQSMWSAARGTHALICLGRLDEAHQALARLRERAATYQFVNFQWEERLFASTLALIAGRFDEAEAKAEWATAATEERSSGIDPSGAYGLQMFMIRREQGRLEEVRPLLQMLTTASGAPGIWQPGLVAAFAELDMLDAARDGFDRLAANDFSSLPRDSVQPLALSFLSDACIKLGDRTAADVLLRLLRPHAGFALEAGFTTNAGPADRCRAALAELCGRQDLADECILSASGFAESSGSPVWQAHVEHTWAWISARRGDHAAMTAHFERSRVLADEFGIGAIPRDPPQPSLQAVGEQRQSAPLPDGLSEREAEVLALLATGQTNRLIGEALFISGNTVANHVRSILHKTGCTNRTEAAAYAVEHGITVTSDR